MYLLPAAFKAGLLIGPVTIPETTPSMAKDTAFSILRAEMIPAELSVPSKTPVLRY